jgi:hypothetical protein
MFGFVMLALWVSVLIFFAAGPLALTASLVGFLGVAFGGYPILILVWYRVSRMLRTLALARYLQQSMGQIKSGMDKQHPDCHKFKQLGWHPPLSPPLWSWAALEDAINAADGVSLKLFAVLKHCYEHVSQDVTHLRIQDMVCGGCGEGIDEQKRRQRVLFDSTMAPLIRKAKDGELRKDEKKLLTHCFQATGRNQAAQKAKKAKPTGRSCFSCLPHFCRGGPQQQTSGEDDGDGDERRRENETIVGEGVPLECRDPAREHYREDLTELLEVTMREFKGELEALYHALGGSLKQMEAKAFLLGSSEDDLSQASDRVAGDSLWWTLTDPPDLVGAYSALAAAGAMPDGAASLCELIQFGTHDLLPSARPGDFHADVRTPKFWRSIGALLAVARGTQLNHEFQDCVREMVERAVEDCKDGTFTAQKVRHKGAGVKGYPRIVEKARDYCEDALRAKKHIKEGEGATCGDALLYVGRVVDIQRCSLEVDSAATAQKLCTILDKATIERDCMEPLRRKNGFHPSNNASTGGYRDVKYNMRFQSPTRAGPAGRTIVEIQVILASYLDVKKRMHAIYKIDRGDYG